MVKIFCAPYNSFVMKVKLYWQFYKSTLILNLASSVLLAIIVKLAAMADTPLSIIYINCCMFVGPFICFYYNELSNKNEYYFYYNKGISKLSLYIITFSIYISIGLLIQSALYYAKLA